MGPDDRRVVRYIETWVRIKHPCPFCAFSERFPEAEMTLWVSALSDLFQVTIPPQYDVQEVLRVGKDMLGYSEAYTDAGSALFITQQPYIEEIDSVMARAEDTECMLIPPMTFTGGWETHRLISRDQEHVRRFVHEVSLIGQVEVLSLKSLDHKDLMGDVGVVPGHIIDALTERQVSALVSAYEAGLFEVPAKVKMDAVANSLGVSRSTFGEHVRKAELELLKGLYPFLKLRCCRDGDPFCGCQVDKVCD